MDFTKVLAYIAILISLVALVFTYLIFKRGRKKVNEDILFKEKIYAFKDICHRTHEIYTNFYDLVDKVHFIEGTSEEREWKVPEFIGEQSKDINDYKKRVYQFVILLPNDIFKKAEDLSKHFLGFVSSITESDSKSTVDDYDFLGNQLEELIELVRSDLKVDKLSLDLSQRIKQRVL
jgi:hypothetical protein